VDELSLWISSTTSQANQKNTGVCGPCQPSVFEMAGDDFDLGMMNTPRADSPQNLTKTSHDIRQHFEFDIDRKSNA
jgi:hypothetical protein